MSNTIGDQYQQLFNQAYDGLNDQQKQAVDAIDGPVLVVAGPGSGKTELLSLRVANILQKTDADPQNILCLTFTEAAAYNMRDRLQGVIGSAAAKVAIHTFHSFGTEVIQQFPQHFYGPAQFAPADELVQSEILDGLLAELDHDNPLATTHPEQGYVYQSSVKQLISQLKQGGVSPDDLRAMLQRVEAELAGIQPLVTQYVPDRVSKTAMAQFTELLQAIEALDAVDDYSDTVRSYTAVCIAALRQAIQDSEEEGTKPLSAWKKSWIEKVEIDGEKQQMLKDAAQLERLRTVADIYEKYSEALYAASYYDFDDMLVDVLQVLRNNQALRWELQEQFQYILVDEFQDTNDAQMQLLHMLTDADIWEGKPNILAVGDDDQSIYKFQGANIQNIQSFTSWYPATQVVTLTKNYRSTQPILDLAMHVIRQGDERLENMLPDVEKQLEAANPHLDAGDISHREFATSEEEYHWIAQDIAERIQNGVSPSDIAIISRKHHQLQSLIPFLQNASVPFTYQKQLNVLTQPHVYQLIQLSRLVVAMHQKNNLLIDELCTEVLSFPFWQLSRDTIWQLSITMQNISREYREQERNGVPVADRVQLPLNWIELIQQHGSEDVQQIAQWLVEQATEAQYATADAMLDTLMGAHEQLLDDTTDAVNEEAAHDTVAFHSPFKQFYFSPEALAKQPQVYMQFLSALRVFIKSVQEFRRGKYCKLVDAINLVDYYLAQGEGLYDTSIYATANEAVELLTAHKAKGLEYPYVYVVGCTNEIWASNKGSRQLIKLPKNMQHISNEAETTDDHLRLFYVAITRAKTHLQLTLHTEKEFSKLQQPLSFIVSEDNAAVVPERAKTDVAAEALSDIISPQAWEGIHMQPVEGDEHTLLQPLLDRYQMSVTHLNNFLDVTKGGPRQFFLDNILRFPQSMGDSAAFGTAMHSIVQWLHDELVKNDALPSVEAAQAQLEVELKKQSLHQRSIDFWLKKGQSAIEQYIQQRGNFIAKDQLIEQNFASQNVLVGDARITGKIDKMEPVITEGDNKQMVVVDFKTGKAVDNWTKGEATKYKVKLYNYKRQLVFYKLLVEGSTKYADYTIDHGALEFLEPNKAGEIVRLEAEITPEEVERTRALIEAVFRKIQALDFPDVSAYNNKSNSLDGILQFEDDLLNGSI